MAPGLPFSLLAIALLLVGTSANEVNKMKFGYSGSIGPEKWGSLSPYCSNGKSQSPVAIVTDKVVRSKNLKPLTRHYAPANATLINHGFNIGMQYQYVGNVGVLILDGKNFTLMQMHWHSPSEHRIDGKRFAAELHLVHQSANGSFSVVAILYRYGDADSLLSKIEDKLEELAKEASAEHEEGHIPCGILNNKYIRQKSHKYYRYIGSLTTPPCTENVIWTILAKVKTISKDQVQALKAPLSSACKNNSRPVQQLNGRHIELYDHDEHGDN